MFSRARLRRMWIPAAVVVSFLLVVATMVVVRLVPPGSGRVVQVADRAKSAATTPSGRTTSPDASLTPTTSPSLSPSTTPTRKAKPRPKPKPPASKPPQKPPAKPGDGTYCAASFLPEGQSEQTATRTADRRFGGLEALRIFDNGPEGWPGDAGRAGRPVIVSFKVKPADVLSGGLDARFRSWFAGAPRDRDIYWSLHHEPEDNVAEGEFSSSDYRAAWQRLGGLADRAGNPRLRATLILMDWSLDSRSGRNWRDYYPGSSVIDVLAFDVYNHGRNQDTPVYYSAEKQLGTIVATARRMGKPFGIAELGSIKLASDSSGAGRARWIRDLTGYAVRHNAEFVAYYDIDYSSESDYRLRDTPSIEAWRDFCSR